MKIDDIVKIRIDIQSEGASALSLMISRIGEMMRQGSGNFPADDFVADGAIDPNIFLQLLETLDENVFQHASVYDHPEKSGQPLTYSIAFLDDKDQTVIFEFRFGTETVDVGELLPYFEGFISRTLILTNDWYELEKREAGGLH